MANNVRTQDTDSRRQGGFWPDLSLALQAVTCSYARKPCWSIPTWGMTRVAPNTIHFSVVAWQVTVIRMSIWLIGSKKLMPIIRNCRDFPKFVSILVLHVTSILIQITNRPRRHLNWQLRYIHIWYSGKVKTSWDWTGPSSAPTGTGVNFD